MPARFFAPDAGSPGDRVALPADEGAHLARVLRLGAGDGIRVFNGRGGEFAAQVDAVDRRAVWVTVGAPAAAASELDVAVTLTPAVLKGDKMDDVVRDAVMLGAAAIQPFVSTRSETSVAAVMRARRPARWARIAIASTKQCGRATIPLIHPPCTFEELLAAPGGRLPAPVFMFVEPGASPLSTSLDALGAAPALATLVVGPEGGWAPHEMAAGAAIWRLVTLRLPTIRADAMPAVGMAALLATWRAV